MTSFKLWFVMWLMGTAITFTVAMAVHAAFAAFEGNKSEPKIICRSAETDGFWVRYIDIGAQGTNYFQLDLAGTNGVLEIIWMGTNAPTMEIIPKD